MYTNHIHAGIPPPTRTAWRRRREAPWTATARTSWTSASRPTQPLFRFFLFVLTPNLYYFFRLWLQCLLRHGQSEVLGFVSCHDLISMVHCLTDWSMKSRTLYIVYCLHLLIYGMYFHYIQLLVLLLHVSHYIMICTNALNLQRRGHEGARGEGQRRQVHLLPSGVRQGGFSNSDVHIDICIISIIIDIM